MRPQLIFVCVLLLGRALQAQSGEYDVLIRNGRVLDGNGNPWIRADIAIKDGRFARIGKVEGQGRREIDASGRYVSPGWIDMLDQSGDALLQSGLAESKLRMGVTTGISGEGGTVVAAEKLPEYFTTLEKNGISMNFGTYYNEAQARVEVLRYVARAPTPEEIGRMQGAARNRHEKWGARHDHRADLPALQLRHHCGVDRNGQGGG